MKEKHGDDWPGAMCEAWKKSDAGTCSEWLLFDLLPLYNAFHRIPTSPFALDHFRTYATIGISNIRRLPYLFGPLYFFSTIINTFIITDITGAM